MDAVRTLLTGLDVPPDDGVVAALGRVPEHLLWRQGERMVTAEAARGLWRRWHPDQSERIAETGFARAFRELLVDSVAIGRRLDRLRDATASLPDPAVSPAAWRLAFEDSAATSDFGRLRILLGPEQHATWQSIRQGDDWSERLSDELFSELGLTFPVPQVVLDPQLPPSEFRCEWNDLTLPPRRGLDQDAVLVDATVADLRGHMIEGAAARHPADDHECAVVDAVARPRATEAGFATWDWHEYVVLCAACAVRDAAGAFVNRSLLELYLLRLSEISVLLGVVVERNTEQAYLVQVLRALLADGIGVRDLSRVLEAIVGLREVVPIDTASLVVFGPRTGGVLATSRPARAVADLTPRDTADHVRTTLRPSITYRHVRGRDTLHHYRLDPALEAALAQPDGPTGDAVRALLDQLGERLPHWPAPEQRTLVIVAAFDVRRVVQRLVRPEHPRVEVLAVEELAPDVRLNRVGWLRR